MSQPARPARRIIAARSFLRGQSFVELALVLPVLLLVVAGTVDLGRAYFSAVSLENAAKEGAFYGARNPECDVEKAGCNPSGTVQWRVEQELTGVADPDITAACIATDGTEKPVGDCGDGDSYRVAVTAPFNLITPIISGIVGNTITLGASASAVVLTTFDDPDAETVPIPTSGATPVPEGQCLVPNFTNGTRRNGADALWQNFALFTSTPSKVGPSGNWLIAWQSLSPGETRPCNGTLITVSNAPQATPTPAPTPTPTPEATATPTPDPEATPTPTPVPTPTPEPTPEPCTVPNLVSAGVSVTQAQGLWTAAGFAASNFSAVRPPNNDYTVGSQSLTPNTSQPCLTTSIVVDR